MNRETVKNTRRKAQPLRTTHIVQDVPIFADYMVVVGAILLGLGGLFFLL